MVIDESGCRLLMTSAQRTPVGPSTLQPLSALRSSVTGQGFRYNAESAEIFVKRTMTLLPGAYADWSVRILTTGDPRGDVGEDPHAVSNSIEPIVSTPALMITSCASSRSNVATI